MTGTGGRLGDTMLIKEVSLSLGIAADLSGRPLVQPAHLPARSICATSRWCRSQSALMLVWLAGSHPAPHKHSCEVTQNSPSGWHNACGADVGLRTISSSDAAIAAGGGHLQDTNVRLLQGHLGMRPLDKPHARLSIPSRAPVPGIQLPRPPARLGGGAIPSAG